MNVLNENLLRIQKNFVKAADNRGHTAVVIIINGNDISNISHFEMDCDPAICVCDIMLTTGIKLPELIKFINENQQYEAINSDL